MDELLSIETDDGKVINAVYREVPSAPIVVISHGMTEHMNNRLEWNFARRLELEGFSSIRYNSYDHDENTRKLHEIGLSEHILDISKIIDWANERSSTVFATGHSFGAMVLLLRGSSKITGGVLWDPANQSFWAPNMRKHAEYFENSNEYIYKGRTAIIYSSRMLEELENGDAAIAAKSFDKPLLVISSPEYEHLLTAGREAAELAPLGEHILIENADHSFSNDDLEKALFDYTVDWMKKVDWIKNQHSDPPNQN